MPATPQQLALLRWYVGEFVRQGAGRSPAPGPDRRRSSPSTGERTPPVVAVALGGAVGAVARALLGLAFPSPATGFPWTTFSINVVGCFLLGAAPGVRRRAPLGRPVPPTARHRACWAASPPSRPTPSSARAAGVRTTPRMALVYVARHPGRLRWRRSPSPTGSRHRGGPAPVRRRGGGPCDGALVAAGRGRRRAAALPRREHLLDGRWPWGTLLVNLAGLVRARAAGRPRPVRGARSRCSAPASAAR